jgi:hypothetical protein
MITEQQNQAFKAQHQEFMQQCVAYKALLASLDFPYSVDTAALRKRMQKRIAEELIQADPSLKLRWEILRTEEGRRQLLNETAASIDLAGYEDIAQVESALASLKMFYNEVGRLPDQARCSFEDLAGQYQLDLGAFVDRRTMTWAGKEHVLAYFTDLAQQLHQARKVLASVGKPVYSTSTLMDSLTSFYQLGPYHTTNLEDELLRVDEEKVYMQALPPLQEKGLLAGFPASVK